MGLFNKKKKDIENTSSQITQDEQATPQEEISGKTDEELIAVIAAAIAAYEAEAFVQTLHIKKINRVAGVKPAWGTAGLNEAIDAGRF